jgi:hypothetical protein
LSPDAFTDTVTEVTERGETPVVQKTARVGEEVVVRTDASEREETVHDTVRRQDVEITRNGEKEKTTRVGRGAMPGTAAGPRAGGPETPVPGRTGTPT